MDKIKGEKFKSNLINSLKKTKAIEQYVDKLLQFQLCKILQTAQTLKIHAETCLMISLNGACIIYQA